MKDTGTLKELTPKQIAKIAYSSVSDLMVMGAVDTPWNRWEELPEPMKPLIIAQVSAIMDNVGLKPRQLHDLMKVTIQQQRAKKQLTDDTFAIFDPYMIPFNQLTPVDQTGYRLLLQLVRILVRYNRNVRAYEKRQRERER